MLFERHVLFIARQFKTGNPGPARHLKHHGLLKAGIIESRGWRATPAAVPLLLPLLSDPDPKIAAAAATALGRIGGSEAISTLSAACDRPPATVQAAVQASLLECAERLSQSGDKTGAAALYRGLYKPEYSLGTRTATWRGLVLTDSAHRTELMDQGVLLLGSDDGVKAWPNGVVVHSHNIERGEKADQDAAPTRLKSGPTTECSKSVRVAVAGGLRQNCRR